MVIYPEGGTSNGTHLLKFKKGAFAGLRSVQPIIIKYKNPVLINECCGYSLLAHSIIYGSIPGTCRVKALPVFMPNDYFWQHHQRQGEEKWETYARVVREIAKSWLKLEILKFQIKMLKTSTNSKTSFIH